MNITALNFDQDGFVFDIKIADQDEMIMLSLSYDLDNNSLNTNGKKIVDFINNSQYWYYKVKKMIYEKTQDNNPCLTIIYILDLSENSIFGLSYESDFDSEHGIGVKISGEDYEILDFGEGDTAFS